MGFELIPLSFSEHGLRLTLAAAGRGGVGDNPIVMKKAAMSRGYEAAGQQFCSSNFTLTGQELIPLE